MFVAEVFFAAVRSRTHSVVVKNLHVLVHVSNDDFVGGHFFPMDCNASHPLLPFKSDPFGKKVIIDWIVYWSSLICSWPKFLFHWWPLSWKLLKLTLSYGSLFSFFTHSIANFSAFRNYFLNSVFKFVHICVFFKCLIHHFSNHPRSL